MSRPAPIMNRVLEILTAAPGLTVAQIAERAGVTGDQVSNALFKLNRKYGEAYRVNTPGARTGVWFHIDQRAGQFRETCSIVQFKPRLKPKPAEPVAPAPLPTPPNRIDRMVGTYTCPELYAAPTRPGAMDAYRLPSRGACGENQS